VKGLAYVLIGAAVGAGLAIAGFAALGALVDLLGPWSVVIGAVGGAAGGFVLYGTCDWVGVSRTREVARWTLACSVATAFAGILAYRFGAIHPGELPAVVGAGLLFGCCSALKFQWDVRRDWAERALAEVQQDDRQLTRLVLGSFVAAIALIFMAAQFGS
jgi:hypothetical protein